MRYFPLTGSTTETIPKTENLHLLLLHHCHFISINPQCDFTTEQSAALCPLKKSQAKTEERARRGCYRKTSSPFPKGLRAPTASPAAQLLCIIGLFHIFFWVQQSWKLLRATGILGDVHRSVQRPIKLAAMEWQSPEERSWDRSNRRWGHAWCESL